MDPDSFDPDPVYPDPSDYSRDSSQDDKDFMDFASKHNK